MKEYCTVIGKKDVQSKINTFDQQNHRLDIFFLFEVFLAEKASTELQNFRKKIVFLFHGNAAVERSFSFD